MLQGSIRTAARSWIPKVTVASADRWIFLSRTSLNIVLGMIYFARGIGERFIDCPVVDAQGRNERAVNDGDESV